MFSERQSRLITRGESALGSRREGKKNKKKGERTVEETSGEETPEGAGKARTKTEENADAEGEFVALFKRTGQRRSGRR
jgi:hypothetical protein